MMEVLHQRVSSLSAKALAFFMMASIAMLSSDVWAQAEDAAEPLRPPRVGDAPSSPKFLVMGVIVVLVALVVIAVTLKTKRGHQD
jgi:hypothetical protein